MEELHAITKMDTNLCIHQASKDTLAGSHLIQLLALYSHEIRPDEMVGERRSPTQHVINTEISNNANKSML